MTYQIDYSLPTELLDKYPPNDCHSCYLEKSRITQTDIKQYEFLDQVSSYRLNPDKGQL